MTRRHFTDKSIDRRMVRIRRRVISSSRFWPCPTERSGWLWASAVWPCATSAELIKNDGMRLRKKSLEEKRIMLKRLKLGRSRPQEVGQMSPREKSMLNFWFPWLQPALQGKHRPLNPIDRKSVV